MSEPTLTVRRIAEMVGGTVEGDDSVVIEGIGAIDAAGPDRITFAVDERRAAQLASSKAGAAIVGAWEVKAPMPLIRVEDVPVAVSALLGELAGPADLPAVGVGPLATIDPDADVAPDAAIAPGAVVAAGARIGPRSVLCAGAVVGANVEIGTDVVLEAGAKVLQGCRIGDRVHIGANSVIGSVGFGYDTRDGVHHLVPHIGDVVIGDDVSIGACSCVDRAKFGSTVIGPGTKIDNLVQIAHNVQIGRGCIIAGQCGVAGSTKLGDFVILGGAVSVSDNVTIGDHVTCVHGAVAGDIEAGQAVGGTPAMPMKEAMRVAMSQQKVPELLKRVKSLESRLETIESSDNN
ncbi:MAG: UDP-3-O-(3-hydroxymyristoyl)glucosamine N-acyltransferase [Planctomycetes bacterium]|nr:UDP-3-O-(3-hydroxymyristoyl)glucosamine N-acyltransferase [Planctomycetota bacterium]